MNEEEGYCADTSLCRKRHIHTYIYTLTGVKILTSIAILNDHYFHIAKRFDFEYSYSQ